jgi:hypothetical protein
MSVEQQWNEADREKTEVLLEKSVPVSLFPPQIPHGLGWNGTRMIFVFSVLNFHTTKFFNAGVLISP